MLWKEGREGSVTLNYLQNFYKYEIYSKLVYLKSQMIAKNLNAK